MAGRERCDGVGDDTASNNDDGGYCDEREAGEPNVIPDFELLNNSSSQAQSMAIQSQQSLPASDSDSEGGDDHLNNIIPDPEMSVPMEGQFRAGAVVQSNNNNDFSDLLSYMRRLKISGEKSARPTGLLLTQQLRVSGVSYRCHHEYTIIKEIGHGTFGQVYLCQDNSTGASFARKQVSLQRFETREVEVLNRIQTTGQHFCPTLYGVIVNDDVVSIYMELIDKTWAQLALEIQIYGVLNTPDTCQQLEYTILNLLKQLLEALRDLEMLGIRHCDIKPDNLGCSGDNSKCFMIDFGTVRLQMDEFTHKGMTPNYMAPEACRRNHTDLSDIWSAAASVIYLYTSKHPWTPDKLPRELKQMPDPRKLIEYISNNGQRMITDHLYTIRHYMSDHLYDLLFHMLHPDINFRWSAARCVDYLDCEQGSRYSSTASSVAMPSQVPVTVAYHVDSVPSFIDTPHITTTASSSSLHGMLLSSSHAREAPSASRNLAPSINVQLPETVRRASEAHVAQPSIGVSGAHPLARQQSAPSHGQVSELTRQFQSQRFQPTQAHNTHQDLASHLRAGPTVEVRPPCAPVESRFHPDRSRKTSCSRTTPYPPRPSTSQRSSSSESISQLGQAALPPAHNRSPYLSNANAEQTSHVYDDRHRQGHNRNPTNQYHPLDLSTRQHANISPDHALQARPVPGGYDGRMVAGGHAGMQARPVLGNYDGRIVAGGHAGMQPRPVPGGYDGRMVAGGHAEMQPRPVPGGDDGRMVPGGRVGMQPRPVPGGDDGRMVPGGRVCMQPRHLDAFNAGTDDTLERDGSLSSVSDQSVAAGGAQQRYAASGRSSGYGTNPPNVLVRVTYTKVHDGQTFASSNSFRTDPNILLQEVHHLMLQAAYSLIGNEAFHGDVIFLENGDFVHGSQLPMPIRNDRQFHVQVVPTRSHAAAPT